MFTDILYFSESSMAKLCGEMKNYLHTRDNLIFQSIHIEKEGDSFSCIAIAVSSNQDVTVTNDKLDVVITDDIGEKVYVFNNALSVRPSIDDLNLDVKVTNDHLDVIITDYEGRSADVHDDALAVIVKED